VATSSMKSTLRGLPPGLPRIDATTALPYVVLVLLVITTMALQGRVSLDAFSNLPDTTLPLILVGLGETIVILSRGIDLSVGGIMSLSTALVATHVTTNKSIVLGLILVAAVGALAGALNGLLIVITGIQPFIVTLATWSITGGVALQVLPTEGGTVAPNLVSGLSGSVGPASKSLIIIVTLIAIWLYLRRTRFGVSLYATGSSEKAAVLNGLRASRVTVIVYACSGLASALAGIYFAVLTSSGSPTAGNPYILDSIAAVVIGGTSLAGGRGGFVPTVVGGFILAAIGTVVFYANMSSYWSTLGTGLILLITVMLYGIVGLVQSRRRSGG